MSKRVAELHYCVVLLVLVSSNFLYSAVCMCMCMSECMSECCMTRLVFPCGGQVMRSCVKYLSILIQ